MYFRSSRVYTVVLQMCRCAWVHRHAVFATPHVAENGRLAVHTLRPGMQSGTQTQLEHRRPLWYFTLHNGEPEDTDRRQTRKRWILFYEPLRSHSDNSLQLHMTYTVTGGADMRTAEQSGEVRTLCGWQTGTKVMKS